MYVPKGGVAVFDSGIGGLNVLSVCKQYCPETVFYYYGDNDRAPYGNLSDECIHAFAQEALDTFADLSVQAAVIACNTVTAVCIERIRARYAYTIIGTEPSVYPAMRDGGRVLVLATQATCKSARFEKLCYDARASNPKAQLCVAPCEQLAGVIEKHIESPEFDFTPFLPKMQADAVVLGCTHYAYIKNQIEAFYGCKIYDGNEGIARRLSTVLREKNEGDFARKTTFFLENARMEKVRVLSRESAPIFFLGTSADRNYFIYEQMFAILGK
jgi:glutamate racemase